MTTIQQSPSTLQPAGYTTTTSYTQGPTEISRTHATSSYTTGPVTQATTSYPGMTTHSEVKAGGQTTYTGPAEVTTRTTETVHQPTYSTTYQQHLTGQQAAQQHFVQAQQAQQSQHIQSQHIQTQQHQLSTQHLGTTTSTHQYVGASREISAATLTGTETIIGERVVEHEIRVPKRVVREEIIEKVIVVPEKIVHEEVIEELQKVREKVVEIAKPVYQEKIIEVPEVEIIEKIIEVPERVVQEKIREVPRVEVQERVVEVPKITYTEKIVEVPEIEYREIPIERVVEVPQVQEQVVIREVPVPQYVDKPIPEHVTVEVPQRIERNIPIPVEAVTTFEYRLPHIRPHYKKATFPVYVPRFVEVPVPEELVSGAVGQQAANLAQHVSLLTTQAAPSLCEIENIAADIKKMDLASHIAASDYHSTIQQAWSKGSLNISPAAEGHMQRAVPSGTVGVQSNAQSFVPVVYQSQSRDGASDRQRSKRENRDSRKQPRSGRSSARVR